MNSHHSTMAYRPNMPTPNPMTDVTVTSPKPSAPGLDQGECALQDGGEHGEEEGLQCEEQRIDG